MEDRTVGPNVRRMVRQEIRIALETGDGSVFSRSEVWRRLRKRVALKGEQAASAAERYDSGQISRRRFLKLLGLGAGGAVVAASGGYVLNTKIFDGRDGLTGYQTSTTSLPGSNTVDLGQEGLSEDDDISPYIDQYFVDGNNVLIPSGSYRYDGSGLNGSRGNCALVGSEEGVEFIRPEGARVAPTIQCTEGTIRVENITVRGKKPPGSDQSRWRFEALDPDSRCEVVNVNHPDGTEEATDSSAFLVYDNHRGTVYFKNCYISTFGNSGFYVNLGYRPNETNPVIIDNCVIVDTNGAIRGGHNGSKVVNTTFIFRNQPPTWHRGGSIARGIRSDHGGHDMEYQNLHFFFASGLNAGASIDPQSQNADTSGAVRDIFIHTEDDYGDVVDRPNWTYENINIVGPGSASAPGSTGNEQPDLKLEDVIWMPESQTAYPGDGVPVEPGQGGAAGGTGNTIC